MRYFTDEELQALRLKFEKQNNFDRATETRPVMCREFALDRSSESVPQAYYDEMTQARWDGYMDCMYQLKNEYEFFQIQAATGDMEDFGDAAKLVSEMANQETNGGGLGVALSYRNKLIAKFSHANPHLRLVYKQQMDKLPDSMTKPSYEDWYAALDKIVVEEYNANIQPLVPQPGIIWG